MTERTPNPQQQALIDAHEGVYVVDAGAGTGKTYTITSRYAALLDDRGLDPSDILLVTFTNNAAAEMKERVVARSNRPMAALRDAPITTFHSWCHELLRNHGLQAPEHLGLDRQLSPSMTLLEDEVIEAERFRSFLSGFIDAHPEHHDSYRILRSPEVLLSLIKSLAAKGVFPTETGWYRHGERHLDGDRAAFDELFARANTPNEGANGPTNSDLMSALSGFDRGRCFSPEAPSTHELRGDRSQKRIDPSWADRAFETDRTALKAFVHDVYLGYLSYALGRNYLNFPFLQLFAFVLLCEDHDLRKRIGYDHVMVDEFQDTSELQFKLALLLCGGGNLCVVGDWKQSIYGFQYASVDNIRRFEDRLRAYTDELNDGHERVTVDPAAVTELPLAINYRSTQAILDQAESSLLLPATQSETVDPAIADEITSLEAATDRQHSVIEAYTCDEQIDGLLGQLQSIVGDERFAVVDGDHRRPPTYGDIAILTRKRRFGRKLRARASELGIPVAFEGGVDLFSTAPSIVSLAWLRILEDRSSDRGWAVVLEAAGYTLEEIRHILETEAYPEDMLAFRSDLEATEAVATIVRKVVERYGFTGGFASALIRAVQDAFDAPIGNLGDLIRFFEASLDAGSTREVSDTPGGDAVTVQTIHAAKGLQYPIVIVADLTEHSFPARGGGSPGRIRFEEPIGLRQTVEFRNDRRPYDYDNWRYRLLRACLDRSYDEERRLLYVAMTRAQDHLLFTADEEPSQFFEALELPTTELDPSVDAVESATTSPPAYDVTLPERTSPISLSPHTLMDASVFDDVSGGRGTAFGTEVHAFAERYVNEDGISVPDDEPPDKANAAAFIDGLEGELVTEEPVYLPVTVDGRQVTIHGVIDLLQRTDELVRIIDFKTDRHRVATDEYRIQLSVYYHVVAAVDPDQAVELQLVYTDTGEVVSLEPYSQAHLVELVDDHLG